MRRFGSILSSSEIPLVYELIDRFEIAVSPDELWNLICRPENLGKITPQWMKMRCLERTPVEVKLNSVIRYSMAWQGIPLRWTSLIVEHDPPRRISYIQMRGPYAFFLHQHVFTETKEGVRLDDRCLYTVPFGPIGRLVHPFAVAPKILDIFRTRRKIIEKQLGPIQPLAGPSIQAPGN